MCQNGSRWQSIALLQDDFSESEQGRWHKLRHRMLFYRVHLPSVDAPAHDCNHNYVDLNHHATRFIFHEITGSVPGFLHRFHTPRLIQRTAASPDFLSETFLFQNIHQAQAYHRKKGEHQMIRFTERRPPGKMNQSITLPGPRCRALHHASLISVASEEGT